MMKKNISQQQGFTLIEMMVSMLIFSVVATTGAGALLKIIDAGKKAQTLKAITNNLHYGLETMSREIRMGSSEHCDSATGYSSLEIPNNCSVGNTLLAFEGPTGDPDNNNDQIVYRLNGTRLEKSEDSGASFFPVTSPDVKLTQFKFYVTGANPLTIPRVVMFIQGYVTQGKEKTRSDFTMQTSVTQRFSN